ncbi:MAG TPA: glycosyltransferase family 87 protein [Lacunisphaera sp.]|nr:glycosyltransferase family 87 protein [Lacunisphaera sp.]
MEPWGIPILNGAWFADLRTLLVNSDAHAAGLGTLMWYSDWWYHLHDLGLRAADTRWLGLVCGAAFLGAVFLLLRPVNFREALYGWLVVCSPPVLLGFNRANVDLPIIAGLILAGWLLTRDRRWLRALVPVWISFLAGLKFYPIAAAAALPLTRRSRRETWLMLGAMAVLAGLLAWTLKDDILRAQRLVAIPYHFYIFGARQILPPEITGMPAALPPLAAVALVVFWWRSAPPPPAGLEEQAVVTFALGTAVLTGCFFAGISYSYRLSICVLMLPLLSAIRRQAPPGLARRLSALALGGLPLLLWLDGIICLALNLRVITITISTAVAFRQLIYGLLSWGWITVVLGLGVMLARPVWQQMLGRNRP